MPKIVSDETFIRIIYRKMVTLLQLQIVIVTSVTIFFFELSGKLKYEKEGSIKDGKDFSIKIMVKTLVLSSFTKEVRKHLRELRI